MSNSRRYKMVLFSLLSLFLLLPACGGGDGGFLLFWNLESEKDFHRFKLPNLARDMDVHPDGIQIATAHYDRHVRITKLTKKS